MRTLRFILIPAVLFLLPGIARADWGIPVNLGSPVNTSNLELLPCVDPGDSILIFLREYPTGIDYMWMSRKINGTWGMPDSLTYPFNPHYFEAPYCITANSNGVRLYFSSVNRPGGLGGADIWYSDMTDGHWSDPQSMGAPINSSFNDNGFRINLAGTRAYFTSQRPVTHGDHDILVSDFVDGQWTTPVNLGDSVNSQYSDQEPTVTEDDQEMYFFRVGPGMRDPNPQIFTARKINGIWQKAHPAGWPIHWKQYDEECNPYLLPPGNRLYYSDYGDSTSYGNPDIWYVDRVVGVEEKSGQVVESLKSVKLVPNPFTSFASVPGHSSERFALFDISGRKVGTYKGDRIGEGLAAGVYFLKAEGKDGKPVRVVKVR